MVFQANLTTNTTQVQNLVLITYKTNRLDFKLLSHPHEMDRTVTSFLMCRHKCHNIGRKRATRLTTVHCPCALANMTLTLTLHPALLKSFHVHGWLF